jgi:DNA-binding transcriptional ArsR family regulator
MQLLNENRFEHTLPYQTLSPKSGDVGAATWISEADAIIRSARCRAVAASLVTLAESDGSFTIFIEALAAEAGASRSTVRRTIRDLEDAGLLHRRPRWDRHGGSDANRFTLTIGGRP